MEMWVKVFSPEVQSVEIVQRSERRKRRARLYYMRFVSLFSVGLSLLGVECFANVMLFFSFSFQEAEARYGQCGKYRLQLSQEEVGSYGPACGETVISR